MGRRTLLLIASILVAALGTSLVWLYVQGADTRAQEESTLVPVLFFTGNAEAGAPAKNLPLTSKKVPSDVAAGAVSSESQLTGTLNTPAKTGQILLTSMLGGAQTGRFTSQGGAMALSISDPNRVPADLRQGDVVDVYAYGQGRGLRVVARCVQVRSVGTRATGGTSPSPAAGAVPPTTITFDVSESTARDLYGILVAGDQPALYDHNPNVGCTS